MNNSIIYRPLTATPFKRNRFYTEIAAVKELQSYIRCYWGTENSFIQIENDDTPELVIPDTCVDIIYHIDYTDNTVIGVHSKIVKGILCEYQTVGAIVSCVCWHYA